MNFKHDQGIMPEFALVFPTGDLIRRNATTKYDQFKVFFNTETATIRENGDRSGSIQTVIEKDVIDVGDKICWRQNSVSNTYKMSPTLSQKFSMSPTL